MKSIHHLVHASMSVGELAARFPFVVRVLENARIDYHLGGHNSLQNACASAHVSVDWLLSVLQYEASRKREVNIDWMTAPLSMLLDHIVTGHHVFTRAIVKQIRDNIELARTVHPTKLSLKQLEHQFDRFSSELVHHLDQEERNVFKHIDALGRHVALDGPFFSIQTPERLIRFVHESQEDGLQELKELTDNFTAPPGSCAALRWLMSDLQTLERDLHEHLHLENNVLFPRAIQLEKEI